MLRLVGAAVLVLLLVLITAIGILGSRSPREQYFEVAVEAVPVSSGDPAAIERGRYFVHAIAVCGVCHGLDLAGQVMSDSPIFGHVRTPNLTPGRNGVGQYYRPVDWARAIRHGLAVDGRAFAFMPVDHYYHIIDADLGDMIAYLESLAPVDNEGAVVDLNIVTRAIINSGLLGDLVRAGIMDHGGPRPTPPAERGAYLAIVGGCDFCHGPGLRGGQGPEPGAPPGPDITGSSRIATWTPEQFAAVMREGRKPEGDIINPMFMPWRNGYENMSTADIEILFRYLRSLPTGAGPD
ncbi:MAG: hypothetical protein IT495_07410 [Gammaproteobacteria bacterium]|nr:hypothetical protein [Gammaproteobacteria bacterium]